MTANINLYDASLKTRRDLLGPGPALAMVGIAVLCMALATGWVRGAASRLAPIAAEGAAALQARQAALQAAAESSAARKPDPEVQNAVASAQRTLRQRRAALQMLGASPVDSEGGFAARLEALARQSVEGLWLTSMVLRQDDVVLKGRAMQPQLIPVYVQRLDREPSLQGRAFKALEVVRPLEKAARGASAAAEGDAAAPLPSPRTLYVEFTLSGSAAEAASAEGEAKP
jgi:Fimbrial assembly protein (PilN)